MRGFSPLQIAQFVWNQIAIVSKKVNVTYFGGVAGTFASGRPEVQVIKSIQSGVIQINSGNATGDTTITAVVLAKSYMTIRDNRTVEDEFQQILNTTTVRNTSSGTSGVKKNYFNVVEYF